MRVRQLIPHLKNPPISITTMASGSLWNGCFAKCHPCIYGIYVEEVIRTMIRGGNESSFQEIYDNICVQWGEKRKENILTDKYMEFYKKLFELVKSIPKIRSDFSNVQLDVELRDGELYGHPDLIVEDCVYDIKTTKCWLKMRQDTIHQLLSYYVLTKKMKLPITKIGLVLPLQNEVKIVSLESWKYDSFWEKLNEIHNIKMNFSITEKISLQSYTPFIYYHFEKKGTIYNSIINYDRPVGQFFVSGTHSFVPRVSKPDLKKSRILIREKGLRMYIHLPHTFNLSKPMDETYDVVKYTIHHMKIADILGVMGVVIHCGKMAKRSWKESYENMKQHIVAILEKRTQFRIKTKLILETSAGEKGELLSHPDELCVFYNELKDQLIPSVFEGLHICMDTCHVFSAGYLPLHFLEVMNEGNVPIDLVHFNNSKYPIGSFHDRHAPIDSGIIPPEQLNGIAKWALEKSIDLINE